MERPYEPEEALAAEDEEGMAMTREQIKDVYFAGTSDGIVFMDDGQSRDLDEAEYDAE